MPAGRISGRSIYPWIRALMYPIIAAFDETVFQNRRYGLKLPSMEHFATAGGLLVGQGRKLRWLPKSVWHGDALCAQWSGKCSKKIFKNIRHAENVRPMASLPALRTREEMAVVPCLLPSQTPESHAGTIVL